MNALLLLLCLAAQDQTAEAKKLLEALLPPLKDSPYAQLEWTYVTESGRTRSGVGTFDRGKAWRLDLKDGNGTEYVHQWDGKTYLMYTKQSNLLHKGSAEPRTYPYWEGGGLADLYATGNSDRLLKDVKKVTLATEKLEEVECSHIVLFKTDGGGRSDDELHFWIADSACKRYSRKYKIKDRPSEYTFTYKVVDPPTVTEKTFLFKPPANAKPQ